MFLSKSQQQVSELHMDLL